MSTHDRCNMNAVGPFVGSLAVDDDSTGSMLGYLLSGPSPETYCRCCCHAIDGGGFDGVGRVSDLIDGVCECVSGDTNKTDGVAGAPESDSLSPNLLFGPVMCSAGSVPGGTRN